MLRILAEKHQARDTSSLQEWNGSVFETGRTRGKIVFRCDKGAELKSAALFIIQCILLSVLQLKPIII